MGRRIRKLIKKGCTEKAYRAQPLHRYNKAQKGTV
jgi:hypothetical protein